MAFDVTVTQRSISLLEIERAGFFRRQQTILT
jgi:hypothetical protein